MPELSAAAAPARAGTSTTGIRRAELLAALSLAVDVGLGQPMEHMLRSCQLAVRLAQALGLEPDRQAIVYYADLTAWIGCHADSYLLAEVFGDDIGFRQDTYPQDWKGLRWRASVMRHVGRGKPALQRSLQLGRFVVTGRSTAAEIIRSHCLSASLLAERLGLGPEVCRVLPHAFERWDGSGLPARLRGDQLSIEIRVVHLADVIEAQHHLGGVDHAVAVARQRRGGKFDPDIVDTFCANAGELLAPLNDDDAWRSVVELEPARTPTLSEAELDQALLAVGDFVDLKLPESAGHSRGVADLAADAGSHYGLADSEISELRRAALVHDLGYMGVSNAIWSKRGTPTPSEHERVRLHPYLTERMLSRPEALRRIGDLACRHHERLDGSGYPHGLRGRALTPAARVLAVADAYHAMLEPRPHREPLSADDAAGELRGEVTAGRLDGDAVDAVLRAAGHHVGRRRSWPAELTSREVEVLRLVATGRSNRDIAKRLFITEKTVRNHLEHIYTKVDVSNRTGASLFAIEHGLVGQLPGL